MRVYELDPLQDPRWTTFVESHPRSSMFHTTGWLHALRRTYGYTPIVLTTNPANAALTNGMVFCRVKSWLTGSRLVSLPFSDHCEPLVRNCQDLQEILSDVRERTAGKLKYAEVRARSQELETEYGFRTSDQYCLHLLNLNQRLEDLYSRLHKDSAQRKIQRARREHVVLSQGRSQLLLRQFYDLLLLTRRRHGLPPQPFAWFRNLVECLGSSLTIRIASVDGQPIASILTVRHRKTIVYKYGCSDARFQRLGGMYHLFWQAIQEASAEQLEEFDLGRSEETNAGLLRFKDNLGARRTTLIYWRFPNGLPDGAGRGLPSRLSQRFLVRLPDRLFRLAGKISYRHAG